MKAATPDVVQAKSIVAGQSAPKDFAELKGLVGKLKGQREFGWARQVLRACRKEFVAPHLAELAVAALRGGDFGEARPPLFNEAWLVQQEALCTYKDKTLGAVRRFETALAILDGIGLRNPDNTHAETLSLGGAIYKRMWEHGGNPDNLYHALSFYLAAWQRNPRDENRCYGGVNAAFIYDQMAFRLHGLATASGGGFRHSGKKELRHVNDARADHYQAEAVALRVAVAAELEARLKDMPTTQTGAKKPDFWFAVTLAEVNLGLGLARGSADTLRNAQQWYSEALALIKDTPEKSWMLQTAFKQALALVRLHGYVPPQFARDEEDKARWRDVAGIFDTLFEGDATPALTCQRGKVGLALSGGGFRASFFHLGVMARLAEIDALRGIDVLSTVSGGSIVGAHYYLEVQHLLQTKADGAISRDDYVELVKRVQCKFLKGVQTNPRMRAISSFWANLRMIDSDTYSRTHRLGEIYEKEIYSHVPDCHPADQPRTMPELMVKPAGTARFTPHDDNWRRAAKVPVLLLNATSLNSGHNWHFTASWMGEPPGLLNGGVDANERYRRLYYWQAPNDGLRNFRMGYAVAASSCVPGLFEPIALPGLYPGRTIRLVDGGVHDNQGMQGLLDEDCTRILCSDASGQMEDEPTPADNFIGVPLRASSIQGDRIREAEYQDVRSRADNHALDGLFFIHLKKNLESEPIDWVGCPDPFDPPQRSYCTTPYGIDKDLQRLLAGIRTDLDSFTEVEANALMLSGYLMAEFEFRELQARHEREGRLGKWGGYDIDALRSNWEFLKIEAIMRKPRDSSDGRRQELERQLKQSDKLFFKIWFLNNTLRVTTILAGLALLAWSGLALYCNANEKIAPTLGDLTWGWLMGAIIPAIIVLLAPAMKPLIAPKTAINNKIRNFAVALFGATVAKIHLAVFDKLFLRQGKLDRLLRMDGGKSE